MDKKQFFSKAMLLLVSCLAVVAFVVFSGQIRVWHGVILLLLFLAFITSNLVESRKENKNFCLQKTSVNLEIKTTLKQDIFWLCLGAVAISFGAYTLINSASFLATSIGVPAQIIGITLVAGGTSLPELVTSLTALKAGKTNLGVGNIIGANVINLTLILGTSSIIMGGLYVDDFTRNVVVFVMLAKVLILVIPTIITGKLKKWIGGVMLLAYILLLVYNVISIV